MVRMFHHFDKISTSNSINEIIFHQSDSFVRLSSPNSFIVTAFESLRNAWMCRLWYAVSVLSSSVTLFRVQTIPNETNSSLFPESVSAAHWSWGLLFLNLISLFPGERASGEIRLSHFPSDWRTGCTSQTAALLANSDSRPTSPWDGRAGGGGRGGGSGERSIKNLAHFQRERGTRQTRLSHSLSNCFLSKVLRATKNKWLMSQKRGNVGCQNRPGGKKSF